jgi:hypothetical protein
MSFSLELTDEHAALREKAHAFARSAAAREGPCVRAGLHPACRFRS